MDTTQLPTTLNPAIAQTLGQVLQNLTAPNPQEQSAIAASAPNPVVPQPSTMPAAPDFGTGVASAAQPKNKAGSLATVLQGGLQAAAAPNAGNPLPTNPFNLPFLPGYQSPSQPVRPPISTPTGAWIPGSTLGQKLQVVGRDLLLGGAAGAAAQAQGIAATGGRWNPGAAPSFEAGLLAPTEATMRGQEIQRGQLSNQQMGLQNQLTQNQVQFAPQIQALNFAKTLAGIQKDLADAGKSTAEAGAVPIKSALEQAQALAARYKEDAGSGQLIDLQTGQPYGNTSALAPLSADEAAILGKQPGDRVPIKLKNAANEMVNRGIHSVAANGRQLLVDSQGRTIKDLGQATSLVTMNAQMNGMGQLTPDMQKAVDMLGHNQADLPTVLMTYRRFPGASAAILGALHDQYPDYFQGNYGAGKSALEYFTSGEGAKNVNAFNTATEHLGQLQQLATALGNNDSQLANKVKNQVSTWFGGAAPTNFNLVRSAVAGEIGKTFKGAVTDQEIKDLTANVNNSMSPGQLQGVINNALTLMRSKMQANVEQYQRARQGQPAFPASSGSATPTQFSSDNPFAGGKK